MRRRTRPRCSTAQRAPARAATSARFSSTPPSAQGLQDLVSGRLDFIAEQISTAVGQLQTGSIRANSVLGLDRVSMFPNLATSIEEGFKSLDCGSWAAIVGPRGMPAPIVQRLAQAIDKVNRAGFHMTQTKQGISALELMRRIGVSYNTAWAVHHKLKQAMLERELVRSLEGRVEMDDAYLGGERSGGKRRRGSPGKTPFVAAVETTKEGKASPEARARAPLHQEEHQEGHGRHREARLACRHRRARLLQGRHRCRLHPRGDRHGIWAQGSPAIRPSRRSTPCSATSRARSSPRSAPARQSTHRAALPSSPIASTAAMICQP